MSPSDHEPANAFARHDHGRCVARALAEAEKTCRAKGLRFTKVRRRVLEILLEAHRAMGAYDVLARLSAEGLGSQPPVAYRALDFLTEHGFVHRIHRLNAFIACTHPDDPHAPAFLICRKCERVEEAVTAPSSGRLGRAAEATGFRIERAVMEVEGLCPACQPEGAT